MHTDLAWQRTIDRQDALLHQARCWRLSIRRTDIDPSLDSPTPFRSSGPTLEFADIRD